MSNDGTTISRLFAKFLNEENVFKFRRDCYCSEALRFRHVERELGFS